MDRVSAANYQTVGGKRTWRDKNVGLGIIGTTLAAIWGAGVQESIIAPVEAVGLTPADSALGSPDTQLLQAIKLFGAANVHATITATPGSPLAITDAGLIVVDATAGSLTVTLPAVAAANGQMLRYDFFRKDVVVANTVTIAFHSGDAALVGGATSVSLTPQAPLSVTGDGVSRWATISPLSVVQFPSSLGTSGWKKIPDPNSPTGFVIEQWLTASATYNVGLQGQTFPIVFPNAAESLMGCFNGTLTVGNTSTLAVSFNSLSQLSVNAVSSVAGSFNYFAWARGY